MTTRDYDDWTISRWRVEPRLEGLEMDESQGIEQAPPLWKDLTLALIVAVLLWIAAAAVFA
jgi:hypothetical protein